MPLLGHQESTNGLEITLIQGGYAHGLHWTTSPDLRAPFWRFYWQLDPGLALRYRGRRVPLDPDHLVIVAPETAYLRTTGKMVNQVFLHARLRGRTPDPRPGITTVTAPIAALTRLHALPFSDPRFFHAGIAVIGEALAGLPPLSDAAGAQVLMSMDPLVREAMYTMAAHDWRGPSLPYFASHFAMHVDAFSRRFRRATGVSPTQWCLRQRIERACELLLSTNDSIEAIADHLGFSDRSHFQRAFRKQRACGPAAFRRTHSWG
jgi:AraC-like DNA-binding protein